MTAPGLALGQTWDCAEFPDLPQQGINLCLAEEAADWDAKLEVAFAARWARLGPADQVRFRDSQEAWLLYRDAACDVEAGAMRGGSGEQMLYHGCRARLTERRVRDLDMFNEQ